LWNTSPKRSFLAAAQTALIRNIAVSNAPYDELMAKFMQEAAMRTFLVLAACAVITACATGSDSTGSELFNPANNTNSNYVASLGN
jgi:hypothetical protein